MSFFNFFKPKTKHSDLIEDRLSFDQDYDDELESWSVTWYVKEGWADSTLRNAKVFVSKDAAEIFEIQLKDAAKLLRCWIKIDVTKND